MKNNNIALIILLIGFAVLALTDTAFASTGAGGFQYETALETFADSITGPVAFTIAIIAMAASGFGIAFGGELTGWIKVACGIIVIVGFIVCAANIFEKLYGVSAALIA